MPTSHEMGSDSYRIGDPNFRFADDTDITERVSVARY
jgi:hypothetical protein